MITSVDFIPRYVAEARTFSAQEIIISIGDYGQKIPNIQGTSAILRVEFFDLIEKIDDPRFHHQNQHLFSMPLAQKIHHFVTSFHQKNDAYQLIIHCEAGISRSAAVALFVQALTQCDFPRKAKADLANQLVINIFSQLISLPIIIPPHPPRAENDSLIILL